MRKNLHIMRARPLKLAALIAAATLAVAGCGRGGGAERKNPQPAKPGGASFTAVEVGSVDEADRPEAKAKADESAKDVIGLLNGYYDKAFFELEKPAASAALADFFTGDAAQTIAPNIEALSIGDVGPKLKTLKPIKQEAVLSFLAEADLSLPLAIAKVAFEGEGNPESDIPGPVAVVHNATYWLILENSKWKIFAYSAEMKADSRKPGAAAAFHRFAQASEGSR